MENLTVDDVYGAALYEAAADLGKTAEFVDAVKSVGDVFRAQPDFFSLLRMPSIAPRERKDIATKVFEGRVPPEILNFIYVLMDKRRLSSFNGIARAFEKQADAHEGVSKGRIESATELTEGQLARFEEQTGRLLRRKVKLEPVIDRALIGGVRIYIDGKFIDASIRGKLDELKERIIS
ncbi:MAG: ATP synthase F1 subunit delta [Clostridiales Family XIII bacterium]|jgi:ATP synthase F1 delta subunit|nr:ATP synthase F1 subunit delta [Clostridiales Family XIII bacterium]